MDDLLRFLVEHCSFLYKEYGFRLADSEHSSLADGYIDMESPTLRVRLVHDRCQIFLDFYPGKAKRAFALDVVRSLITGEGTRSAVMDSEQAEFVRRSFPDILALFGPGQVADTVKKLKELERMRAKKLFG